MALVRTMFDRPTFPRTLESMLAFAPNVRMERPTAKMGDLAGNATGSVNSSSRHGLRWIFVLFLFSIETLSPVAAQARDVFINTSSGPGLPTQTAETHAIGNVFGIFDADSLSELFGPDYTRNSEVTSRIDMRYS